MTSKGTQLCPLSFQLLVYILKESFVIRLSVIGWLFIQQMGCEGMGLSKLILSRQRRANVWWWWDENHLQSLLTWLAMNEWRWSKNSGPTMNFHSSSKATATAAGIVHFQFQHFIPSPQLQIQKLSWPSNIKRWRREMKGIRLRVLKLLFWGETRGDFVINGYLDE